MNFLNLIQGAAGKVKGVATLLSGLTKTQAIIAGVATVTAYIHRLMEVLRTSEKGVKSSI